MEVSIENVEGIPESSIISIRAGQVRKQGSIGCKKPMSFSTDPESSNPFAVDVYAPIGGRRLTLVPNSEKYQVDLGSAEKPMKVTLAVRPKDSGPNECTDLAEKPQRSASRQQRREKHKEDCKEYLERHKLAQFMQNIMQSVLVEQPEDPFLYMEKQLRAARGCLDSPRAPPGGLPALPPPKAEAPPAPKKPAEVVVPEAMRLSSKSFAGPAFSLATADGPIDQVRPLEESDLFPAGSAMRRMRLQNLALDFTSREVDTPLRGMTSHFLGPDSWVSEALFKQGRSRNYYQMLSAGPREKLHFKPPQVVATIVTCGGLCPGLNSVIRQLVQMLRVYGVEKIYGIRGGYKGVTDPSSWIELQPQVVQDIHDLGGTVLSSDRGNPPIEEQVAALKSQGVRQHFVIGGDGTHRGAYEVYDEMRKAGYECAVVGVPKTIDNDIPMLDRTFGFDTACTEAVKSVHAAYTEATCNANCIGLVKLMGRHCGFIAMNACLAARYVDICLLPEMDISLEKVVNHCVHLMQTKGHAVVVVAEGCGDTLLQSTGEKDAGGNAKLADVGPWLRDKIMERFKEVKLPLTIKYIDPTYMIRAVKPNANDSVYCSVLAEHAVHAAMAGYTGVTIGKVCERFVMLPIQAITMQKAKRVDLKGRWFVRMISTTKQPDLTPDLPRSEKSQPAGSGSEPDPLVAFSDAIDFRAVLGADGELRRLELEHLSTKFGRKDIATPLEQTIQGADLGFMNENCFASQTLGCKSDRKRRPVSLQMLRAGPRKAIHFHPPQVAAAIVTCGGLCPGLNSVIRELVMMLYNYGVRKVYGIKGGFKGTCKPNTWLTLTPDNVKDIHMLGGTILVSDRGNPTDEEMAAALKSKGVRQFFVIGGDGTHRGAYAAYQAMGQINWECAVVGVPKTIDNDIALLDRTFGFDTACSEALKAINTAYTEATCNANCIGLVKLMGRHCGYLAMMSVLSARYVDICLLPEMEVNLDKVLDYCATLVSTQGHAVIVVAEGCGDTLIQSSGEMDAGGNKKLGDAGLWLKEQILSHFQSLKLPLTIKYVDPTYMVRAVPANANDSIYCSMLSQAAVHAAMAGYTGITVAKVNETFVYLPIRTITETPNRKVDIGGHWFERLLSTTLQPNLGCTGLSCAIPALPPTKQVRTRKNSLVSMDDVRIPGTTLTTIDGYGNKKSSRPLEREDVMGTGSEIRRLQCFHLSDRFGSYNLPNPLKGKGVTGVFQDAYSWVAQSTCTRSRDGGKAEPYYQMRRAGPCEKIHFDPNDPTACAAIVSCGGICPGLNSVIREVVNMLWAYGVRRIYGIKGGYKGVVEPDTWMELTPEAVCDIHTQGGTMLVSDRGNPPVEDMAKVLQEKGVRQYFVLGGDGTHKGASQTFDACLAIDHECSVIGVPKTIDNDVPLLDQTFGFDTACTEAVKAVNSAYVEATCNANCIGLVKLMGRHCGFIAMHATLASRHVDICLLPEMDVDAEKVLEHCATLMRRKKHCVIVVAEGCGDTLIKSSGEVDAGGNKVLADAGLWLKGAIAKKMKELEIPHTIKYIDPTYMIRSIPANAFDSQYCSALAQNAVHAALAGFSGITVGKVHERYVYLPIHAITMQKGRRVDVRGRWFMRMLETTRQPDFNPEGHAAAKSEDSKNDAMERLSLPASVNSLLEPGDEVRRLELVDLSTTFESANIPNPCLGLGARELKRDFLASSDWATKTFMRLNKRDDQGHVYYQLMLSGARKTLHFDPSKSSAIIVTCGGLCPGLNSVIRELVMTLTAYGVPNIFGCKGGYKGMLEPEKWLRLDPDAVQDIHNKGGTILVSDRGNPPCMDLANVLKEQNIQHYFVIGGDGTHRGAMEVFKCTQEIGHNCSVVGVPKTIDNDIPILDRSFGYKTACTEAVKAINSAYIEATSNVNCIGLVKLMGRHCGWIAMEATLAARHVDICILPEMDVSLPKLLLQALTLIQEKGHAVIVVAEGCGDTLIQSSGEKDAGGNKKLADVGPWLQAQLLQFCRGRGQDVTIKFIDPTYTIRAVPANANDSVYCSILAQHAVHGSMAGYSGISVGKVDERYVMLPIHAITQTEGARTVNTQGRDFRRLMNTTGQPNLAPGQGDEWALLPKPTAPPLAVPCLARQNSGGVAQQASMMDVFEWRGTQPPPAEEMSPWTGTDIQEATLEILNGFGDKLEERVLKTTDLIVSGSEVRRLEVMSLRDRYGPGADCQSPLVGKLRSGFLDNDAWALEAMHTEEAGGKARSYFQLMRAGPRETLFFDPRDSSACAAIVTCGGLSPGENVAIREIVHTLYSYGCRRVMGIIGGFGGILQASEWLELTPESVEGIHQTGGTILKTNRGNPDHQDAAVALKAANVKQLFALGGEGTLRGVLQLQTALANADHGCACVGIPASINNDLPLIDRTFGFDSACTLARDSIMAAYVEATCNANCIGMVKLAGSQNGFLALEATLAARTVDICLLPEMQLDLNKVLDQCEALLASKGYAVVTVTDGCLASFPNEEVGSDVGHWLKDKVLARFKEKEKPLTIKYIDPTYMVRSDKANALDTVYGSTLAEHAVHGAMAGITGVLVAKVNERNVYMPLQVLQKMPRRTVDLNGRWFGRLMFTTGQPPFEPDGFSYEVCGDRSQLLRELSTPLTVQEIIRSQTVIKRLRCANLRESFEPREVSNPLSATALARGGGLFVKGDVWCSQTLQRSSARESQGRTYLQCLRAGAREKLHFDTNEPGMAAAIVTCGGLCPGLNAVIRELVKMLFAYGVKKVYGIKGGYNGWLHEEGWLDLTPESVQDIHMQGGSILVSDRGNPPHGDIAEIVRKKNIRQYFVLGGDGTHQGALASFLEMTKLGHECAVVGVPKTIDNDIQILDRSFGFETACAEALRAIDSAYVESSTNANCIGLVKLMGRHCGWIAATATLAARHVDAVLLPEMNVSLEKFLQHVAQVMRTKRRAVIVVAEGCGDTIISAAGGTDAGGNKQLADVGPFLKDEITKHCKEQNIPLTIKYIDPTYMVRSVHANAYDSRYCASLAQCAVHGAMAGYTGITVGKVDDRYVMLPIHAISAQGQRKVDLNSRIFERLMATTKQPCFEPCS